MKINLERSHILFSFKELTILPEPKVSLNY